jgi:hypothetical protein
MFKRKPKIDFEHACRGLVKMIADTATINKAERDGYITAAEAETVRGWIPWRPDPWTQSVFTSGNIRRDPPSLLKWWRSIRESRPAPAAPTPNGSGWFSALK